MDRETRLQEKFRNAMRRFANTVSIVSVQSGAERHGSTATSVTSVSMTLPSLLICFNQESRLHAFLKKEDRFCVNLLHIANCDVSEVFSSAVPAAERFASGRWRYDCGIPYLADAQANLFCSKDQEIIYGSHTIFIGRVTAVHCRDDIAPLIYRDGAYAFATDLKEYATSLHA